jgi:hypothetical protein
MTNNVSFWFGYMILGQFTKLFQTWPSIGTLPVAELKQMKRTNKLHNVSSGRKPVLQ